MKFCPVTRSHCSAYFCTANDVRVQRGQVGRRPTQEIGGRILDTNKPGRKMFGLDARQDAITSIVDPAECQRLLRHSRNEKSFQRGEVRFQRRTDSILWTMTTARFVAYDDGAAIRIDRSDIPELKRLVQDLLESRQQLRRLSGYMVAIREEERKLIAMEVRDEPGQLFAALKIDVSLCRIRLAGDREATRKADEMRELREWEVSMLRDAASEPQAAALDWLVEDFSRPNVFPASFATRAASLFCQMRMRPRSFASFRPR
ncbi:PAS domain-containing protein [Paraburkholderia aspalathi]|uniref:PAC domain-containing protein n=1 Tax=Paraburkholderia aspalathi TaxID=1324617 RepID=A0A1I7EPU3_9BURK|nr:hypothetical protein [Paraburkholderia aspalathi]SFU25907.1 hypothetical protein SAMN05192563_104342 [Paraburkholderia aspalathi]